MEPAFQEHSLFYWHREAKNANAEVDYLCTCENDVAPVEVRAGTSGSLKSIQVFLTEKKRCFALRFNMDQPSLGSFSTDIGSKIGVKNISFTLLSLPLYLAGQTDRLLRDYFQNESHSQTISR